MNDDNTIDSFQGEYRFLSNFYTSPIGVDDKYVDSVEHLYQGNKPYPGDPYIDLILKARTPGEAKRLGKQCTIDPDFESLKLKIMEICVRAKFQQNISLAQKLLDTGNKTLIEGNTWGDTYWGVCKGVGENNLGKILMKIRTEIQTSGIDLFCNEDYWEL
jgi:ribA/ribD-fused uncharacterized protein